MGAPCFVQYWFPMVTWGEGAFLKSSQALRVGARCCQELPKVLAGLVGPFWGGGHQKHWWGLRLLTGYEQLLICP